MNITVEELKKIINIEKYVNVDDQEMFDYCRITKIFDDEPLKTAKNALIFPVTVTKKEVIEDGWYISSFDNRTRIKEFIDNSKKDNKLDTTVYVIEKEMEQFIIDSKVRYIVVDNIMDSIDKMSKHILKNYNGKKIVVTGSVGKTSLVGQIEQVIKDKVLRIYSKRITPLILNSYIINYLNEDVDYLVMEAGLFRKFHVEYFADILKPDIGIILNAEEEHLGVDGIDSLEDIIINKSKLLKHCKKAIINSFDKNLANLKFDEHVITYNDIEVGEHDLEQVIQLKHFDDNLKPYIKTHLSLIQNEIAAITGKLLHIDYNDIINRINTYVPIENRILKQNIYGKEIIFEGDVSSVERLKKFSHHFYEKSALVIRNLTNDGEEVEDYSRLTEVFNRFNKVYLFDDLKEKDLFLNNKNVEIVSNHNFIKELDEDTQIFYHYGSYYRKFKDYDFENLEKKSILMIHGWNSDNYNHLNNNNSWNNRRNLVEKLEENFNVHYFDLPGFGTTKEPKKLEWDLNDYARYVKDYIKNNNLNIDYVLGYSFGGAVALRYKTLYNSPEKLFLISPAIVRKLTHTKKYLKTPKMFDKFRKILKDFYVIYIVKNEEMAKGTKFLRNTYNNIVRIELDEELRKIDKDDFLIIYGENDTMVDPNRIINYLGEDYKDNICVIENGTHDIGNTHSSFISNRLKLETQKHYLKTISKPVNKTTNTINNNLNISYKKVI